MEDQMKKLSAILMVFILLASFVWAEDANPAIKHVQWSREMTARFTTDAKSDAKLTAKQILPAQFNEREVRQIQKANALRTGSAVKEHKTFNLFKSESLQKPTPLGLTPMGIDTLIVGPDGIPDTISYVAGNMVVLVVVTGTDTAVVNFLVDGGDGVYGSGDELALDPVKDHDMVDVKLWDGIEFDESPAGDGIFMVTLNTSEMNDGPGPIMAIQNAIVFIDVAWVNSMVTNYGRLEIGAPDENTSISGVVTTVDGSGNQIPAPNVIVVAVMPGTGDGSECGFLTKTAVNGQYRIEIPDMQQGHYFIIAQDVWQLYPGVLPEPPSYELDVWGDIPDVNFRFTQGSVKIHGFVRDQSEMVLANVPVIAKSESDQSIETVTNADGYYELWVNPGWWRVVVEEDFLRGLYMFLDEQWTEVYQGGDYPVDFTLYALDSGFSGHVSFNSGAPVEGVEINTNIWMGDRGYSNYTKTDANGDYYVGVSTALQGQVVGDEYGNWTTSYWLGAWYEDGIITPYGYNDLLAPQSGLDFTVIKTDASLSGTVYNANDNSVLYNAQIHASLQDNTGNLLDYWASTDEYGHYEVALVGGMPPNGSTWMIEVYWPYEWMPSIVDSMSVLSGNNYTKDYYINPPVKDGFIEGYVFDKDGNGIQNARVEIYGPNYFEVYTNNSGYFSVGQLPFGLYSATAYAEGYDPYDIWNILVGPDPVYLEFWMGSAIGNLIVNGHVKDAQAAPIPNAIVMAFNWTYNEPFTLFTDSTGYYELKVKPDSYDFQVGANGFLAQRLSAVGIMADTTLDFTLVSAGSIADTLNGSVVDESGNKLRKVFIYLETDTYIGFTYTNLDGQYKVALPAGTYNASYSKKDFNTEWRTFTWPDQRPEDPIILYPTSHVIGPIIISVMDVPQDHGKQVRITWKRAEGLYGAVKEYQIWRAVQRFGGPESNPDTKYDWDYITTVPVNPQMDPYNMVVPTLYDKVGNDIYWSGFMICAIGWDGWSYWNSNILAGWSEDNLPPTVPTNLGAFVGGESITLEWQAVTNEKVKYYTVYRKTASTEFGIVGYSTSSEFVDLGVSLSEANTYAVTATDFGLNESAKSEPITVNAVGINKMAEIPTEFALRANYPNPFNPETTIEFALPKTSQVTLTIYNLNGQLVQQLVQDEYQAGYQRVIWNGKDYLGRAVGSGVYIYTLKAGDFHQTRKMILMR